MAFEDEVRRVAEAVWDLQPGECTPVWYDGDPALHEIDGIARLPEVTHLLMVTTSRKLEKIKDDVKKLNIAAEKEERRGRGAIRVEKWLITEERLEAPHVEHARKFNVKTLTLAQFRGRFFNGRDYIAKRRRGPFGSARNLQDGSIMIPENEYVELPMTRTDVSSSGERSNERPTDLRGVIELLFDGEVVVLLGPFGAGKSLTTREIFLKVAREYLAGC